MELPAAFAKEIKACLGPEYDAFAAAMGQPPRRGLRFHSRKTTASDDVKVLGIPLEKVPWAPYGYRFTGDFRPALHPYYHAGLYYIQEPSAMLPAEVLSPLPGQRVLDLCAAPGGKGTRLGECLAGEGLLFLNDSSHNRCQALVRNVELFGLQNVVILNETPARLAARFPGYFHKVLVDAPCSGQGMFRKDHQVAKAAGGHRPFAQWQQEILAQAALLTAPGGEIVYSTCTFRREENEDRIQCFLAAHPDFSLLPIPRQEGFCGGLDGMEEAVRLWPHRVEGEGHFVAHLRRQGAPPDRDSGDVPAEAEPAVFRIFREEAGLPPLTGRFHAIGGHWYFFPAVLPALRGLKVVRAGLYLGEEKNKRFIPGHSLALAQPAAGPMLSFAAGSREVEQYLKGLMLSVSAPKGMHLFGVAGHPLGWVKSDGQGMLKNHYPKAWRNM